MGDILSHHVALYLLFEVISNCPTLLLECLHELRMTARLHQPHIPLIASRFFLNLVFAFTPGFENYPPVSITCLSDAAKSSGCNEDTSTLVSSNACLCNKGGTSVTLTTQCVGECAPGAIEQRLHGNVQQRRQHKYSFNSHLVFALSGPRHCESCNSFKAQMTTESPVVARIRLV